MTETFACPECGDEVTLQGATPGREVQCTRCATWVEVPYFPRAGVWTRARFRESRYKWLVPLAWSGVGLLALLITILAVSKYVSSQNRAARESALNEFVRAADTAEKSGQNGTALVEIESALAYLKKCDAPDRDQVAELKARRDRLSLREAEARLEAAAKLEPAAAVGDLLLLQQRARTDRALVGIAPAISDALDSARRKQVNGEIAGARKAAEEKRPLDAIALFESALTIADKLDPQTFRATMAEAESILGPILGLRGVIITQQSGQFTFGSSESYSNQALPYLIDGLRQQGYMPRPSKGPAAVLWDRFAGQRLEYQPSEAFGVLYLQSQNRISNVNVRINFKRGGATVWHTNLSLRTQVPLPDRSAFVGSRLAVADRRSSEAEKILYDDAFASFLAQITPALKGVPAL